MHKIRKPFYVKKGQQGFDPDGSREAVGIGTVFLIGDGDFEFEVDGKAGYYKMNKQTLRQICHNYRLWTAPNGRKEYIIPISVFERFLPIPEPQIPPPTEPNTLF